MSLRPFAPHHYGIVVREDPIFGYLTPVWAADEVVDVTAQVPGQVVQHAIQSGGLGPSDVRIRAPESLTVTFRISEAYSPLHPRPEIFGPGRALRLVEEIQEIARIGQPVSVLVRGFDLLPSRVIENVQVTFARETAEATIQATFVEVRQVTLSFAPVEQDADLVAMGSQAQATIGLF